jgi:hypothetical protein
MPERETRFVPLSATDPKSRPRDPILSGSAPNTNQQETVTYIKERSGGRYKINFYIHCIIILPVQKFNRLLF